MSNSSTPTLLRLLAVVLTFLAGQAGCARSALAVEIFIDPGERHQMISGWEATAELTENPAAPMPASRPAVLDTVVDDIGINRVRLEIRSGAETRSDIVRRFIEGEVSIDAWRRQRYAMQNDNTDPNVIDWAGFDFSELDWHVRTSVLPLQERLAARGEKLFVNVTYVSFRDGYYFQQDPEEYAEFVLATYMHLKQRFGIVPDAWEVILEPDMSNGAWDGRTIGRAVAAAARRLRQNGFTPAFIVPSVTNVDNAARLIDEIAQVPGAMDAVVEFSYHRYRGNPERSLPQIARRAEKYGKRTSMLEFWFGRGNTEVLHQDLKLGQVSAWQGRVIGGHVNVANPNDKNSLVLPRDEVRYNLQYFRYIRAGAQRVGASSSDPRHIDPLAFVNTNGKFVVVALAEAAADLTIRGLPAGRYRVSFAVSQGSILRPERLDVAAGEALKTRIPGAGVITIFAE